MQKVSKPSGDPTRFLDRSFVWIENAGHSVRLIQRDQDDNDPRKGISIKWEDLSAIRELITLALEDGPMVIGPVSPTPESVAAKCPDCDHYDLEGVTNRCNQVDGSGAIYCNCSNPFHESVAAPVDEVSAVLVELRELSPGAACSVEHVHRQGFGTPTPDDDEPSQVYESRWTVWVNSMSCGEATTLSGAMAKVREWKNQEAGKSNE